MINYYYINIYIYMYIYVYMFIPDHPPAVLRLRDLLQARLPPLGGGEKVLSSGMAGEHLGGTGKFRRKLQNSLGF